MPDPAPPSPDASGLWLDEPLTPDDRYLHRIRRVLVDERTPYQQLQVVDTGCYGRALVLDGRWQSATVDEFLYHETLVQPTMVLHGQPKSVLVLGAGEGATAREILRWPRVEHVALVEIDGRVIEACRQYLPEMHQGSFDDPRVELVIGDALEFLARDDRRWDVIVSDLSEPTSDGPSVALFTREYFARLEKVLAPGGLVVVQAGSVSPVDVSMHARLSRTVEAVFPHVHSLVTMVPSFAVPWGFILANRQGIPDQCDPNEIDAILARSTRGRLRAFDGPGLLSLLQMPRHIRTAIESERRIFTKAEPWVVA